MTSLPIFLRPSTKILEIDLTQRIDVILSTTAAIVGEFARGSLDPTYQSGIDEDFRRLYGKQADPTIGFAHDTYTTFATQSANALIVRTTKNAKYAGLSVLIDSAAKRVITLPFSVGTDVSYSEYGSAPVIVISTAATLATGNKFKMDITDGATLATTTEVTYATSHNATMENIAASIQDALNTFSVGSTAEVYHEPLGGNNKLIVIRPANNVSLQFDDPDTTGFTAVMNEETKLFDVFAENPGDWANDYGIKLSEIDTGIRERYNLTLAGPMVAGSKITVTINGTTIETTYATSSDATLAAFATALQGHPNIDTATVQVVPGATNNDRTILIIAKKPGADALSFTSKVITGGSTNPIVVSSKVMTGIAADNSFTFEVFSRGNTNLAVESFEVALPSQLSSRGYQQNVAQVINRASNKSYNIRILQPASAPTSLYDATTGDAYAVPETISWLEGGDLGVKCTSAEIRAGWRKIDDRVQYPFSVMLNAGYTQVAVQKEMVAIAEQRSDCIAILDAPSDRQGAQDLRSYRLNELDIDTSYGAMYTPDVEIEDDVTGERRFIPPSGPVGATYAYSDRLTNYVGAPAGLNRGKVTLATGLRYRYTNAEQELLYPVGINYIQDKPGSGPTVMAEETLQMKKSVLSSVHARRILNYIKTGLVDGLDYVLFDPNTESTRFQARQIGKTICQPLTDGGGNGGLYGYTIKCDGDNNTPEVIDADQLAYDVYLQITRVIKGILVRAILTRTGAKFEEIVL